MIKTILVATAAFAIGAFAAVALGAVIAAPPGALPGDWCLKDDVQNGGDVPRTKVFRRGTDCPEEERVEIYVENGFLAIDGAGLDLLFPTR
jgi:hypothetical protein